MKITKVDVMQVKTPNPSWKPILCRVYTDEGIYGDGEAALAYGIAAPAAFGMIRDLAALIIGMDPLDNEVVWDTLYKNTFWGQNGGPVVFAGISAIDFALWDIRGKFFNVPVYKLLGGKKQDNLRCYASQLQFGWSDHWEEAKDTEEYAANARKAVEEGYDAIKIDFFTFDRKDGRRFDKITETTGILKQYYVGLVEERVAAVREAVGPDVDIIPFPMPTGRFSWQGQWRSIIYSISRSLTHQVPKPQNSSRTTSISPYPMERGFTPDGSTRSILRTCPCRLYSRIWVTAAVSLRERKSVIWLMYMTYPYRLMYVRAHFPQPPPCSWSV